MVDFFLKWFPIFAAALVPLILTTKNFWRALLIILLTYFITSLIAIIIITMWNMMVDGQGDPALVAGQIAEHLVGSIFTSVVVIPLALLIFFCWRKYGMAKKGTD